MSRYLTKGVIMPKPKPLDWTKFIPLGVLAIGVLSGYIMLQARVGQAEEKLKSYEMSQQKLTSDTGQIQINQARQEEKLTAIYEAIKEIRK